MVRGARGVYPVSGAPLTSPALLSRPLPPPSPGEEGEQQETTEELSFSSLLSPLPVRGEGGVGRGAGVRVRAGGPRRASHFNASRFANSRYAPGTPAGSSRK